MTSRPIHNTALEYISKYIGMEYIKCYILALAMLHLHLSKHNATVRYYWLSEIRLILSRSSDFLLFHS